MASPSESSSNARKRKRGKEPRKAHYLKKILANDKATKCSSFKKRMPTVMRKASQLETLCGISVCVVCYAANGDVETWPKDKTEARNRVLEYKRFGAGEKRECSVVTMLEASKKNLVRKVAREVAASFSSLADPSSSASFDAALKRIEDKIEMLKSTAIDQHHTDPGNLLLESKAAVEMGTCTVENGCSSIVEDDFDLNLDDIDIDLALLLGSEATVEMGNCTTGNGASSIGENGDGSVGEDDVYLNLDDIDIDLGLLLGSEATVGIGNCTAENGASSIDEDGFYLSVDDIDTDLGFLVGGEATVEMGTCTTENGASSILGDDCYLSLDDIVAPISYDDAVKLQPFGNPMIQDYTDDAPLPLGIGPSVAGSFGVPPLDHCEPSGYSYTSSVGYYGGGDNSSGFSSYQRGSNIYGGIDQEINTSTGVQYPIFPWAIPGVINFSTAPSTNGTVQSPFPYTTAYFV